MHDLSVIVTLAGALAMAVLVAEIVAGLVREPASIPVPFASDAVMLRGPRHCAGPRPGTMARDTRMAGGQATAPMRGPKARRAGPIGQVHPVPGHSATRQPR